MLSIPLTPEDAVTADITLLDCTLRDGGYYTKWDYSRKLVDAYLGASASAGIDVVEIGYRLLPTKGFKGAYAYSADAFLKQLPIGSPLRVAVMSNSKELLAHPDGALAAVDTLYGPSDESPVDIVRITAEAGTSARTRDIIERLVERGYQTTINLMQVGNIPLDTVKAEIAQLSNFPLNALYFADSFGNLTPERIQAITGVIREESDFAIGFHAHDNMGRALENTLAAIEAGCRWIDSTISGMGRGAGNARTEYLLLHLATRGINKGDFRDLLRLELDEFTPMRAEYGWGTNVLYYVSALYGIHPSYVQELLKDDRLGAQELFGTLEALTEDQKHSYSRSSLTQAVDKAPQIEHPGTWSAATWAGGRDILLIGPGESALKHLDGIELLIKERNPLVLHLNYPDKFPVELIDAIVLCHPNRLRVDLPLADTSGKPIIAPLGAVPESVARSITPTHVHNYGVATRPGRYEIDAMQCVIPRQATGLYALAVAAACGPQRLYLAGFDGFEMETQRGGETAEMLTYLKDNMPGLDITAITPTRYAVNQSSVYAYI